MANVLKKVTITQQGSTSGPLYDIYYSIDGSTYTLCPDGDNVFLFPVGSYVIVTVPDNANFIKAVNLHPGCNGNDVIINFGGLTTTTTTSGPTTTTTTLPPLVFYNLVVQQYINDRTVFFTDLNGVSRSFFVDTGAPVTDPGRLLNYKFAAIKGTVTFSNPLGCNLTTLIEPFTPNFVDYSINFSPTVLPNRYFAYQSINGTIQQGSNYTLGGGCMVSGSFTNTSANFSLTNNGGCSPIPTTTTTTLGPTTTTTTTPPVCKIYNWSCDNEFGIPCSLVWTNCDGSSGDDFVSNGSSGTQCAQLGTFGISNASFPTTGSAC
jgi:hypothetical protein